MVQVLTGVVKNIFIDGNGFQVTAYATFTAIHLQQT